MLERDEDGRDQQGLLAACSGSRSDAAPKTIEELQSSKKDVAGLQMNTLTLHYYLFGPAKGSSDEHPAYPAGAGPWGAYGSTPVYPKGKVPEVSKYWPVADVSYSAKQQHKQEEI